MDIDQFVAAMSEDDLRCFVRRIVEAIENNDLADAKDVLHEWSEPEE